MLIGLSLSKCVRDIANGKVPINKVKKIIAGTKCRDDDSWDWLLREYSFFKWQGFPEAVLIARQLRSEGKIEQPRVEGKRPPSTASGWWIQEEEEGSIIYQPF